MRGNDCADESLGLSPRQPEQVPHTGTRRNDYRVKLKDGQALLQITEPLLTLFEGNWNNGLSR
jgi:hypothetical protein